jgi:hypothetical protein
LQPQTIPSCRRTTAIGYSRAAGGRRFSELHIYSKGGHSFACSRFAAPREPFGIRGQVRPVDGLKYMEAGVRYNCRYCPEMNVDRLAGSGSMPYPA